jgi:AcrR family transcriptional regulator
LIKFTKPYRKRITAALASQIVPRAAHTNVKRPGRRRDGATDVAILDATERLLGRRGYEAMTVEQVAATAGVSKPTVYLRFSSKRDLVAAMIDRLRPPLPESSTGSVARDLVALMELQRAWVDAHGLRIVAAVLLEQDDHPELMDQFQRRVVQPSRRAFARVLEAGVERGELRPRASSPEVIDALTGAYWGRAWATEDFTADWSRRLVTAVLELVAA